MSKPISIFICIVFFLGCLNATDSDVGENFETMIELNVPQELFSDTLYTFSVSVEDQNVIGTVEILDVFDSDSVFNLEVVNETTFESVFTRRFKKEGTYYLEVLARDLYPNGEVKTESISIEVVSRVE